MRYRVPWRRRRLAVRVASVIALSFLSSCGRNASEPLTLTLLYTNEVGGYLQACG
jgi:hypothetical protein